MLVFFTFLLVCIYDGYTTVKLLFCYCFFEGYPLECIVKMVLHIGKKINKNNFFIRSQKSFFLFDLHNLISKLKSIQQLVKSIRLQQVV